MFFSVILQQQEILTKTTYNCYSFLEKTKKNFSFYYDVILRLRIVRHRYVSNRPHDERTGEKRF